MSAELVYTRRDDAVVHVILNRSGKRNALDREVLAAGLAEHFDPNGCLQEDQLAQSMLPIADAREGAALAERRTPRFTGR